MGPKVLRNRTASQLGLDFNVPDAAKTVKDLAKTISRHGPPYVLLKGGHLEDRDDIFDVLYDAKRDAYSVFAHK